MASRLPPLNPLRAFEATARLGSLTRAATELAVTHGAVSHQIRALEAALDVQLFERGRQRLRLTAHGAELLPSVSSAFAEIAGATSRLTRPSSAGTLSVTCVPALLSFWLLPRLSSFTARFPDIRLRIDAQNDAKRIHAPGVDLCILYGNGDWPDCWTRRLSGLDLFPVVSPSLLNNQPIRTMRDMADHLLIHADDGREWNTWLSAADALELKRNAQHYLSDARLAVEAAIHGCGVALGDTITASRFLAQGQLVAPFNLAVPAVDDFYIACRSDLRAAPVVQVFIDWLIAQFEGSDARVETHKAARRTIRPGAAKASS